MARLTIFLYFFLFCDFLLAQSAELETPLVNGKEYYPYFLRSKRKPLLFMDKMRTSSVIINGSTYNAILHYDTFTDEIIYSVPSGSNLNTSMISLNRNIINSFTLNFPDDTMTFRKFSGHGLEDGFYESVYEGTTNYLVKHRSLIFEKNGIDEYFYRPVGYVLINGEYHKLRSGNKFPELFAGDGDLMRDLLRKHRINFRKPGSQEIAALLREYDSKKSAGQ